MAREVLGIAGGAAGWFIAGPAGAKWGFIAGSILGGIVDPPHTPGPRLGDAGVQTSRDGGPIPIGAGIFHVVGNIMQMNPLIETTRKVSSGKGGGPTTTETRRTRTFAIRLGRGLDGPITGILRVLENNKLIYDNRTGSSFPAADNTAFEAGTNIYLGTETQLPDSELEAETGVGLTPPFRGLPYIVFVNKDITDFGSSIPQYRFELWSSGLENSAATFSATEGHAITQYDWYDPTPNFEHPFRGEEYSEYTISTVARATQEPTVQTPMTLAQHQPVGGTFGFQKQPATNRLFFNINFHGESDLRISQHSIFLDSMTGWEYFHWYWLGMSYSQPLNKCWFAIANLTLGDETAVATTVSNNINVWWQSGISGVNSVCGWGGGTLATQDPDVQKFLWHGYLSQVFIHNQYSDFSVTANRRKFAHLDGVVNLGIQGQIPFGSQAKIYMANGLPSSNTGSLDVGDFPTDFWLAGDETLDEQLPPVSAT